MAYIVGLLGLGLVTLKIYQDMSAMAAVVAGFVLGCSWFEPLETHSVWSQFRALANPISSRTLASIFVLQTLAHLCQSFVYNSVFRWLSLQLVDAVCRALERGGYHHLQTSPGDVLPAV